jgi:hypothetical protein
MTAAAAATATATAKVPQMVFVVVMCVALYYNLFVSADANNAFFIAVIIGGVFWHTYNVRRTDAEDRRTRAGTQRKRYTSRTIPTSNYTSYKNTSVQDGLQYLRYSDALQAIAESMTDFKIYDEAMYHTLLSHMDNFMKLHYKTMLEKYDFGLMISTIKQQRNEVLNHMHSFIFVLPKWSTIRDIPDLHQQLQNLTDRTRLVLDRKVDILYRKFRPDYQNMLERDMRDEAHGALYV